jgi:beta-N-acetylhexosaminidase
MIDELVGQLIWAFISTGQDLELAEKAARKGHIGGIWLLPTEMRSPAETVALVNWLQAASPRPLLVGVDAEAGMGLVMGGATQLPTAMALGASGDPHLVCEAGAVTAAEARACGINTIAAPVLDVNVNPDNPIINTRAFGESPDLVARLGMAFIEGLQQATDGLPKVLSIGKHFPGHGDTVVDSHLHLDSVSQPRGRLETVELPPFRAAIVAGIPMLMTAHVAYPALDDTGTPATLSRPILTDLLRGELGFGGAVVTDCMNMYAVAHKYEGREAAVRAVQAGCDLVLTHQWGTTYEAIMQAVLEGDLPPARLQEAAERVRRVKVCLFGPDLTHPQPIDPEAAEASVGTPAHAALAEEIALASVTLVEGVLLPPSTVRRPLIMATRMARRFGPPVEVQLRAALTAVGWEAAEVLMLDPIPDAAQVEEAREHARAAGWAALLHFNRVQSFDPEAVLMSDELVSLAAEVASTGVPVTAVSMGSPYALPRLTAARARLCSYSTCEASLRATLRILMGEREPVGRLPVHLS